MLIHAGLVSNFLGVVLVHTFGMYKFVDGGVSYRMSDVEFVSHQISYQSRMTRASLQVVPPNGAFFSPNEPTPFVRVAG